MNTTKELILYLVLAIITIGALAWVADKSIEMQEKRIYEGYQ